MDDNVLYFEHWCNIILSAEVPQDQSGVMQLGSVGKAVYEMKKLLPDGTERRTHDEEERINSTLEQTHFIS